MGTVFCYTNTIVYCGKEMRMLKRLLTVILMMGLLIGCGTAEPAEAVEWNMHDAYSDVAEENVFYEGTEESLTALLEHGIGIIFLGFPECPWCQAYAPMLNETVSSAGTRVLYYNIYEDKVDNATFYDRIAAYINEHDSSILSYNSDGRLVIYMPLVLFVQNGEIIAYDHETCTEDSSVITPEEYWTDDKVEALKTKLLENASLIAAAQEENDSQGCSLECAETDE